MYNIQILSDVEFEALPYPETETSLGIADPSTNTAFVRHTASDDLNRYLINHELEHLIEGEEGEHSSHFRNGVYYKGFGEILQMAAPALSFIPGIGPLLSGAAGIGGGFLSNRDAQKAQAKQAQSFQQGPMGNFNMGQERPSTTFPTQSSNQGSPFMQQPSSMGASGGTGALGGLAGSAIDKLRPMLQGNQGNFLKGNYALRGGF